MTARRLTAVQKDVLERLKDGWVLRGFVPQEMTKHGEALRHIKSSTRDSLERRGLIVWEWTSHQWVLAE